MFKITSTLVLLLFASFSMWSQALQFTQHSLVPSTGLQRDVKAADMDGDGDMDALVTGGGKVVWYRNADGNGTFDSVAVVVSTLIANFNVGNAADVDGDGDMDVIVGLGTTSSNSEVAWFKNLDGLGTVFGTKIVLTNVGDEFREVIAADFDGDLDMDIVFGSYITNEVKWMRNTDGAGAFSAPITLFSGASGIRFMAVADTDGDNDMDFFTSSFYPVAEGQFTQYRNSDGLGAFVRQKVNNLDGNNAAGIAAGDLDGDGDIDLVGCIYNSDVVYWYKNDGLGNFGGKISITTALDGPFSVCIADLEGDGDNDLVVASEIGNKISYLLNNGLGGFSAPVLVSTALSFTNALFNPSRLIATADFDSDGDMDIVAISTGSALAWFEQEVPLVLAFQTQNPLCNGASNGSIFIQAFGGVGPYTYVWNNALLQGDSLFGLTAGAYQVTLTDQEGTEIVQDITLQEPSVVEVALIATPSTGSQNDGTASVFANGGVGNYTYLWSNGATIADLTNLAPGLYSVIVTDANGCTQSDAVLVEQNLLPLTIFFQTTDPTCSDAADGAILIGLSGGLPPYNFIWNNMDMQGDSVYGLPAGVYFLTITDDTGNQLEQMFVLTAPPAIVLTMNVSPYVDGQNNGAALVIANGGSGAYTYLWSNGATTSELTNLAPGPYSVIVTDANGCTQTSSVVVVELVGTNDSGLINSLSVWPNPAHDWLQLDLSKVISELKQLDLLNADGRLIRRVEGANLQPITHLQWENNQPGDFVMLVFYGRNGGMYSRKIIIH